MTRELTLSEFFFQFTLDNATYPKYVLNEPSSLIVANTQLWLLILVTFLAVVLAMYAIVTAGYCYRLVDLLQVSGPGAG